ncbi:MAG: HAD-IIB family hydrolase [Erysipelotrichaceae bacterium]|nr:HAD-IIB family hydrolase [Erysipelotrichaceae bacterium]
MISKITALAADVDMTLAFKGEGLPQINYDAFIELHKRGVKLGLATGREVTDKLKAQARTWGLPFDFDFLVGMNGGMVYDLSDDSLWSMDPLSTDEMKAILTHMMPLVDKYKVSVNAEGLKNHNAMNIQGELMEAAKRHGFDFVDKTDDVDGFCDTPAYKILFRGEPENEAELRAHFLEKFGEEYQIIGTFPGTVEAMKKGISKGQGLKRYAEKHNIPLSEIISFGDNENDNSLLEVSGWGVCLKDGSDGTKAVADAITDYDCEHGGFGHYIYDYCLDKI